MLSKLIIKAFSDKEMQSEIGIWKAQINPEGLDLSYGTLFNEDTGVDTASVISRFRSQAPEELKLKFVLDGTGVLDKSPKVDDKINEFKTLAYDYNGDIHSQNYLLILRGDFRFRCILQSLGIEYSMFAPSGQPLRATLSCGFKEHQTPESIARRANKKSADLTHAKVVEDGMSLPLMCHRVYRDPGYAVAVAKANGLDSLYDFKPGDLLAFPPLSG